MCQWRPLPGRRARAEVERVLVPVLPRRPVGAEMSTGDTGHAMRWRPTLITGLGTFAAVLLAVGMYRIAETRREHELREERVRQQVARIQAIDSVRGQAPDARRESQRIVAELVDHREVRVIPPLIRILAERSRRIRVAVCFDDISSEAMRSIFKSLWCGDWQWVGDAIVDSGRDAVPFLIAAIESEKGTGTDEVQLLIQAFGRIGPESCGALLELLDRGSQTARLRAVEALDAILVFSPEASSRPSPAIKAIRALCREDSPVGVVARDSLRRHGGKQ